MGFLVGQFTLVGCTFLHFPLRQKWRTCHPSLQKIAKEGKVWRFFPLRTQVWWPGIKKIITCQFFIFWTKTQVDVLQYRNVDEFCWLQLDWHIFGSSVVMLLNSWLIRERLESKNLTRVAQIYPHLRFQLSPVLQCDPRTVWPRAMERNSVTERPQMLAAGQCRGL